MENGGCIALYSTLKGVPLLLVFSFTLRLLINMMQSYFNVHFFSTHLTKAEHIHMVNNMIRDVICS